MENLADPVESLENPEDTRKTGEPNRHMKILEKPADTRGTRRAQETLGELREPTRPWENLEKPADTRRTCKLHTGLEWNPQPSSCEVKMLPTAPPGGHLR